MKSKDTITTMQAWIAVASFASGVIIACICLFLIKPLGEIDSTAISVVSELLILAGALLGVKAGFDHKQQKFEAEINNKIKKLSGEEG